jgi:hypothetical protein
MDKALRHKPDLGRILEMPRLRKLTLKVSDEGAFAQRDAASLPKSSLRLGIKLQFNPCVPWGKEACFEPTRRRSGGVRTTEYPPTLVNPPQHMAGVAFASKPRPAKHNLTGIFGDRNHGTEYKIARGRNPAPRQRYPLRRWDRGLSRAPLGRSLGTAGTYQHRPSAPPIGHTAVRTETACSYWTSTLHITDSSHPVPA